MRRVLISFLAIVTLLAGGVAWTASSASSATAPTYSLTIAGTDMHALDPHYEAMFVAGGGVQAVTESPDVDVQLPYLEAQLNFPVGAKVTSIAITQRNCINGRSNTFILGSYSPATRNTVQNLTVNVNGSPSCTTTVTKTGNPILTAVAGRRYALDFRSALSEIYPGGADAAFYGATVKYTCTSPCVP